MPNQRHAPTIPPLACAMLAAVSSVASAGPFLEHLGARIESVEACGVCPFVASAIDADLADSAGDSSRFLRADASASARVRVRASAPDCRVRLEYLDSIGLVVAGPDSAVAPPGSAGRLFAALSDSVRRARTGVLTLESDPPGALAWLDGREIGATPAGIEGLRPGRVAFALRSPGWAERFDTASIAPGETDSVFIHLDRSAAWIDSVRRDSIWADARARPARDLPELFDRLAVPVATDPWVSVVVLPFEAAPGHGRGYDGGLAAAEFGIARWKRDPRFVVLRRELVRRHARAGAFAGSAAASDSAVAAMGALVSARYVVTGTVTAGAGTDRFEARMVSVRTGTVAAAATATVSSESVDDLYGSALGDPSRLPSVVARSAALPGWGQFHAGRTARGFAASGVCAAAAGVVAWAWSDFSDKDGRLRDYRDRDASTVRPGEQPGSWWRRAEEARTARNDAAFVLGLSVGALGIAWAGNVVDAFLVGRDESRRMRARYYAARPVPVVGPDRAALAWSF